MYPRDYTQARQEALRELCSVTVVAERERCNQRNAREREKERERELCNQRDARERELYK